MILTLIAGDFIVSQGSSWLKYCFPFIYASLLMADQVFYGFHIWKLWFIFINFVSGNFLVRWTHMPLDSFPFTPQYYPECLSVSQEGVIWEMKFLIFFPYPFQYLLLTHVFLEILYKHGLILYKRKNEEFTNISYCIRFFYHFWLYFSRKNFNVSPNLCHSICLFCSLCLDIQKAKQFLSDKNKKLTLKFTKDSQKLVNKKLQKHWLAWWVNFCWNIQMVGSEFGMNNMKVYIYPALYQQFMVVVMV